MNEKEENKRFESKRNQLNSAQDSLSDDTPALKARVKILKCFYQINKAIRRNDTVEAFLSGVLDIIPKALQWPEKIWVKIFYEGNEYVSENLKETKLNQRSELIINGEKKGWIELLFDDAPEIAKNELNLVDEIARYISETIEFNKDRSELYAANQQLKAANQQLAAAEQQLIATNQQLLASEQQLRAANQQLTANEQQLSAAKEQAERNEKYYHAIINNMGDPVFVKDDQSRLLLVNDSFCELFELERPDILGKTLAEDVTPEERESFLKIDREVIRTGEENINEETLTVRGKETRVISTRKTRIVDAKGNKMLIGVIRDFTSRRKAEIELQHSHKLMRYVIEHSNSAIAIHDKDLKYLYVSQSYLDQYKVKDRNVIGKHHYDVFPDLPEKWRNVHKRVLNGEVLSADNDPYEKEDGTTEWTRWECRPWFDSEGAVGGLIVYTQVITEEKRIRDTIKESELKYRTLFESVPIGLTVSDGKGNIIETNKMAEKMLGLSAEDQKKRSIDGKEWSIIQPDNSPFPPEEYASVRALKENKLIENVEMGIVKNNDDVTWISVSAIPVALADVGVIIAYNDITRLKQAEKEALEIKEKYQTLVELSSDLIWAVDGNGKIIEMSPYSVDLYGYKPEELIGRNFLDFVPDKQQLADMTFLSSGLSVKEYDSTFIHKDGHVVYLKANSFVEKDEHGNVVRITGTSKDVTNEILAKLDLQLSNYRYKEAQRIAKVGNWEYNLQTTQFWGSDEAKRIYGFNPDAQNFTTEEVESCIPDRENVHQALIDLIENNKPYDIEFEIITKDKKQSKIIHSQAVLEKDSHGNPVKVTGVIHDITERKNAELELEKYKQHLENLVETRTAELMQKNEDLERFNQLFIGREFRIKELKEAVKELKEQLEKKS